MTATLNRTTFEISRAEEYFDAKELQAQTGQQSDRFAVVALKELIDNALDACETAGVSPRITIEVTETADHIILCIQDNGPGIEPDTVRRILNFQTRTSDKTMYRAPTRGAQGNALKTVLGMPHALGGRTPVCVEAKGVRHTITAWVDPAGDVCSTHATEETQPTTGTCISVTLPRASQWINEVYWARAFALFNPHASVKIRALTVNSKHTLTMAVVILRKPKKFTSQLFRSEMAGVSSCRQI